MASNNRNLAMQLKSLSVAVERMEDSDLLPIILDTCSGLLQEVQKRRPPLSDMDDIDRAGYVGSYTAISGLVGTFVKELRGTNPESWDETRLNDAMAQLEQQRQAETNLKNKILVVQGQVDLQEKTNDELKEKLTKQQNELKTLEDFYTTLQDMAKECTPEIIEQQKQKNADLLTQYNNNDADLKKLQETETEHRKQLQQVQDKITATQNAIDAMPEENRRLVEQYDELSQTLRRIEKALEECSPEEQEKLSEKIRELKPRTEDLKKEKDELDNIYRQLQQEKTVLSENKQELETNILALLDSALGPMTRLMTEHRDELVRIRKEADGYREDLEKCEQMKKGYEGWLGASRTQFDASLQVIDREENTNLRQTLRLSEQNKIKELFADVKADLEEADRMLCRCKDAARRDQNNVEGMASKR